MSPQDEMNRRLKLALSDEPAQSNFALDSTFAEIESEKPFFYEDVVAYLPQIYCEPPRDQFAYCQTQGAFGSGATPPRFAAPQHQIHGDQSHSRNKKRALRRVFFFRYVNRFSRSI